MPIDTTALAAYVAEHNRRATFDGRIADLERICRRDLPAPEASPDEDSRPWYAREILLAISAARHWLAEGRADFAASEAVVIGALAATAEARHNWPEVQRWNKLAIRLRAASKTAARVRRENAARDTENLRAAVDDVRRKRPELSVNGIAQVLHDRRSDGREEDRDHRKKKIAALAKAIARLEHRTSFKP